MLYLGMIVGGIGGGIVYTTSMGNALKLFPDRRGLAAGITSMAFGGGAALSVIPISNMIKSSGFQRTFLVFGIVQGAIIVVCSILMRRPSVILEGLALKAAEAGEENKLAHKMPDTMPVKMLSEPVFWVLYVMFTMVATGGLMAVAQLGPIAKSFKIADTPISVFGLFVMAALPLTLALNQILNGLTRPFFGWLSDLIGRELTMFIAFTAEGIAIFSLIYFANNPIYFVLFSALAFFAWGEIYSIFPAISGDLFGAKFASTNYGILYTAKGTASLLIPLGSWLQKTYGSWKPIFYLASAFDIIAALLAILALEADVSRLQGARQRREKPAEHPRARRSPARGGMTRRTSVDRTRFSSSVMP